jgi:hypothetical protein
MATATTTPISKFRNSMVKFLDKLDEWAEGNRHQQKELEKFRLKYDMTMKVNPRDSLIFFTDMIEEYADHILIGNEEFFLSEIEIEEEDRALQKQLNIWWPDLENNQKQYIKNTFKLLLMLAAIATKHEGLREIINKHRSPDNQLVY